MISHLAETWKHDAPSKAERSTRVLSLSQKWCGRANGRHDVHSGAPSSEPRWPLYRISSSVV